MKFTVVSAVILAVAKSIAQNEKNGSGRSRAHKPTSLADFEAVCPDSAEYAKQKFDEYIKEISTLHSACFELAKADRGSAINKAIAEYINGIMGDVGHITASSFSITRIAAKTVKDVCTSFDKSTQIQFRRALEVAMFNIAVEYKYADKGSLEYFKARMSLDKNSEKLEKLPGKIKVLEGFLGKLEKDTPEYNDINNQLDGAKKSFESAREKRGDVLTKYNAAVSELDKAVKEGSASMTAELLSALESGVKPAMAALKIIDKLTNKAKTEQEKKSA